MGSKWEHFGHAAHFICGHNCRFHLATLVGKFLVSTVGELVPDESSREIYARSKGVALKGRGDERLYSFLKKHGFVELGYQRTYETMVFKAGKPCIAKHCHCGLPAIDGSELDFAGYNNAKAATDGHRKLCLKWSKKKGAINAK